MDGNDGELVAYVEKGIGWWELYISGHDGYATNMHITIGIWDMEVLAPRGILMTYDRSL